MWNNSSKKWTLYRINPGSKLGLILSFALALIASCSPSPAGQVNQVVASPAQRPTVTLAGIPCTVIHTPIASEAAFGSQFEGHGHITGPAGAPVTIIAFSDYQCPACALLAANLKQIRLLHQNDVRLIYLHAPQSDRDKDTLAIQVVEAADLQGKFWEMNDMLFEKLAEWSNLSPADFLPWVTNQASSLGIDPSRLRTDFDGSIVADRLQQAVQFASTVQSINPPILFINGNTPYTGLADFASLDTVIRLDALAQSQFSSCPNENVNPLKQYIATLHTPKGDLRIQLFPDKAPIAVSNFIFLAHKGWYNGNTFYRVLPGQMVMTGDPSGTGYGNPGYLFETEIPVSLAFDKPGIVAMDNNGPNTNGSRFFITLSPAPNLDGQYTIFGQVLSGLEFLSSMTPRDPQPGIYLSPGDTLTSVLIEER